MKSADLIFHNGCIYTMESRQEPQRAVAILGNRIVAVGDGTDMRTWSGPGTEVIDLHGRAAIPGLIDSHVHFVSFARRLREIDLAGIDSLEEAVRRVASRAQQAAPGEWLLGGGWNHNLWGLGRFPRKEDVDHITGDHPMLLRSKDGHVAWVNNIALKIGRIDASTMDPAGGEIERDPFTGEPTGILKETAETLIGDLVPEIDADTLQGLMKQAMAQVHQAGVTSVHNQEGALALATFQILAERGEMGLRVCNAIPGEHLDKAIALGIRSGFGNEWLRIGAVKIFADGALGSRTADMLEPYDDEPENLGIEVLSTAELKSLVSRAVRGGICVAIHAIGDRANRRALDALEASIRVGEGAGLRHRIEHAQLLHPADLPRFAQLGVIASMQPIHCTSDMRMADLHWGKRSRWSYAWRSLLDSGARLAFGSDAPVEPLEPLAGIYAAVTRQRPDGSPAGGWYPEERISVMEAVYGFTMGAAYASGEETIKGSIAPGKLADLVVLSQDILVEIPEAIPQAKVDYTVLDGKIVYARAGA